MVKRLFVEKKPGFDVEAGHVKADLCDSLGLDAEVSLRLLCRYDVEGVSEEEYTLARDSIFSEPNVDNVFDEAVDLSGWRHFTTEYLPGQYDQRAESAAQCIQLLTQGSGRGSPLPRPTLCGGIFRTRCSRKSGITLSTRSSHGLPPTPSRRASTCRSRRPKKSSC